MLIDQLPEIVKQPAQGIAGANLTVLNGSDGLGQLATGLVGQGLAIFDALRGELGRDKPNGESAPPAPACPPRVSSCVKRSSGNRTCSVIISSSYALAVAVVSCLLHASASAWWGAL
jgi:hypothetical protein